MGRLCETEGLDEISEEIVKADLRPLSLVLSVAEADQG